MNTKKIVVELVLNIDKNIFADKVKSKSDWESLQISGIDTTFPLVEISGQSEIIDKFKDRVKKDFPDFVLKVADLRISGI